ncbi:hypothetical protein Enr13x_23330 [Stieleria neptunia]|uniref:Uncharacterized protein n=1 Tax=Stieleria neptunia TaxID=2527979 RepID=A0A518HNR2_9BACT|nr:hypothetical protein [Stieleria neptunia]QDV42485.1 hypothetical protein Enr13x_23330 [Stieleria neptunia]
MAEHQLPLGRALIDGLIGLGRSMGYCVKREHPVLASEHGEASKVDVAWFSDDAQRFPLMIFEVESRAGNTIASNPLKVFAQDVDQFEKPLFYFQVIAEGKAETSRIQLLKNQYGTHNYRLYRLGRGEWMRLLIDVVKQHGRIRSSIDYVGVYNELADSRWPDEIDPIVVLDAAYDERLSQDQRFAEYAWLAQHEDNVRKRMPNLISEDQESGWNGARSIPTYLAHYWAPAILSAWMIGRHHGMELSGVWDNHLNVWNNESLGYMRMFEPEFFTHDYAQFILSIGGPFVACLAGLAQGHGSAINDFVEVLRSVLERFSPGDGGLQIAVWLCHISARMGNVNNFDFAFQFIQSSGGLSLEGIVCPPSSYLLENCSRNEYFPAGDSVSLTIFEFQDLMNIRHGNSDCDRASVAFQSLCQDNYCLGWSDEVLATLWSRS